MEERSVKETIREEIRKLSALSWGERLGYIWDYYKPLMVGILVVIGLISIGVTAYRSMQINRIFNAYLINCNSYETDSEQITAEFTEYIGGIGKNDQITVDTTLVYDMEDYSEYARAGQMKMVALLAAGEIDLMLLDEKAYQSSMGGGVYQELSQVIDEEQLDAWKEHLMEGTDPDDGSEGIFAVEVSSSPVLARNNAYPGQKVYAVIVPGTEHLELCVRFLNYLLGL